MSIDVYQARREVTAVVDDVLPRVGVAYVRADDGREWTITKSTQGPGLAVLEPGKPLLLVVGRAAGVERAASAEFAIAYMTA